MKRMEFTLQFAILLAAIPFLVFVQFRHDYSDKPKAKTQTEFETAQRSSISDHIFPLTALFELD